MAVLRMRQGRKRAMNNWLWMRVTSQAFTITVIAGGFFLSGLKQKELKGDREAAEVNPCCSCRVSELTDNHGSKLTATKSTRES